MSEVDFKKALADAGIPTTEAALKAAWEAEVTAQGSKLANTSAYSPFWRVITALVTKPVLWILTFVTGTVLPNFFLKTATSTWLDMLAWAVNVERKAPTKAIGSLLFSRATTVGSFEIPIGTRVQSASINGNVYELVTKAVGSFAEGESQVLIPVTAIEAGSGFNLAPGYYAVLPVPVPGVVRVVNLDGWLATPGSDAELDDDLRLRARNQFSAVNQWHTDAVYRALIAAFPGVSANGVYFEHGAPRGPGSANAYVLFEADAPANTFLQQINARIMAEGNHGHGDSLLVLVMPETQHDVSLQIWPVANLTEAQRATLKIDVALFIRAAFRESTGSDYAPTLTWPQSRFSFSRLVEELHEQFPSIESMKFGNDDIISALAIPRLRSLAVVFA